MDNIEKLELKDTLTQKNYKFIEAISKGYKPPEAYQIAGYKGKNDQQPYQLMHALKYKISEYLRLKGFNQETVAIELDKLLSLPLRSDQTSVTVDQKIKLIRLLKDALPESEKKEPSFTRFTIINGDVKVAENKVIDVKPVDNQGG
jgi:hypothetical protein